MLFHYLSPREMGGTCRVAWLHVWFLNTAQRDSRVSSSDPLYRGGTTCSWQVQEASAQLVFEWDWRRRTGLLLELCLLYLQSCHYPPRQPWLPQQGLSTDHQTILALKQEWNYIAVSRWILHFWVFPILLTNFTYFDLSNFTTDPFQYVGLQYHSLSIFSLSIYLGIPKY